MKEENEESMGQVIKIDEARIRDHLGEMAHGTVEEKLNAMLVNAGQKIDLQRQFADCDSGVLFC